MRPPGREKISGMQKASKIEKRLEKKVALVGRKNLQAGSYAIFFGVILKRSSQAQISGRNKILESVKIPYALTGPYFLALPR